MVTNDLQLLLCHNALAFLIIKNDLWYQRLFHGLKILILCVIVLSVAVAILSTKSVNAMADEYPSLNPYWFSDNNVNVSMYLFIIRL